MISKITSKFETTFIIVLRAVLDGTGITRKLKTRFRGKEWPFRPLLPRSLDLRPLLATAPKFYCIVRNTGFFPFTTER